MFNLKNCCESIVKSGFGIIEMPPSMLEAFRRVTTEFAHVDAIDKASFSFPLDTDGFLQFGYEYAKLDEHPDLCERFCYWHAHSINRQHHTFTASRFMEAIRSYETKIHVLAQELMNAISEEFDSKSLSSIRTSSYLQLCAYARSIPRNDRKFAQDPHEDGHLISFIKPDREGLVLVRGESLEPVRLLENEIAVLAGSLLTDLSDQAIPAAYHAVLTPPATIDIVAR